MNLEQLSEYRHVEEVSQWAIRDGERIVGGLTVVIYRQDGKTWALLTGVHLEPEYRGRGLINCLRPLLKKYPQISGSTFFRKYASGGLRRERRSVLDLRRHTGVAAP